MTAAKRIQRERRCGGTSGVIWFDESIIIVCRPKGKLPGLYPKELGTIYIVDDNDYQSQINYILKYLLE
jgi:hypothetical protein